MGRNLKIFFAGFGKFDHFNSESMGYFPAGELADEFDQEVVLQNIITDEPIEAGNFICLNGEHRKVLRIVHEESLPEGRYNESIYCATKIVTVCVVSRRSLSAEEVDDLFAFNRQTTA